MAEGKVEGEQLRYIVRAANQLRYNNIKELQFEVIRKVITGYDVFAVLPTGFGKSLLRMPSACFWLHYKPEQPTIVCVISQPTQITELTTERNAIFSVCAHVLKF